MLFISTTDSEFDILFPKLCARIVQDESEVEKRVRSILVNIRERGDQALLDYTRKFDGWSPQSPESIVMTKSEINQAEKFITKEERKAIEFSAERIFKYHKTTFPGNVIYKERGIKIQRKVIPLDRVGIYCPGGKAGYPSTVLMTAIPALVAGVKEISMATPAPGGKLNPYTIFAAKVVGIETIYKIGGAQAIFSLAYGTGVVKPVDKIVGPGNIYVATAKRLVQGSVGVDLIAGPSELVVICDGSVNPIIPAVDIIAQAEHDERAFCVVVSNLESYLVQVKNLIHAIMKTMPRREIIEEAFRTNSYLIHTRSLEESIDVTNRLAPEHVGILTKNSFSVANKIRNAGTVFVGVNSPPAVGDYLAGPSHVLPTGGTARFTNGLSVEDFVKKTNIIFFTKRRMVEVSEHTIKLAEMEGLFGHAHSVRTRINSIKSLDYVLQMLDESPNQEKRKEQNGRRKK
ncbi:MAG: histidinol dehydrogenase [Candidatus Calescibacterium sp.]|nr:histidinol dehydrogenase [Candidatus Calescibacterium sp.]MDW8086559.1 histidinol dehydrogenase [Candidatus Calescibacterium sp.]